MLKILFLLSSPLKSSAPSLSLSLSFRSIFYDKLAVQSALLAQRASFSHDIIHVLMTTLPDLLSSSYRVSNELSKDRITISFFLHERKR
ncbi:hypothetical protein BX666DRAFT_1906482 [Dichotomocladium elegans]|nr:hypothetical protein BX666DRAFT_1906482 [Dichotomocladium elegans]